MSTPKQDSKGENYGHDLWVTLESFELIFKINDNFYLSFIPFIVHFHLFNLKFCFKFEHFLQNIKCQIHIWLLMYIQRIKWLNLKNNFIFFFILMLYFFIYTFVKSTLYTFVKSTLYTLWSQLSWQNNRIPFL